MNKVALITGGARRIGAETAEYLHSKGINILITYSKSSTAARNIKKQLNSIRRNHVIYTKPHLIQIQIIKKSAQIY